MPTFTLSQLEQRIWDSLDNNSGQYPEPQLRLVVNEGLRRLNLLTGFNQATVSVSGGSVANRLEYSTPAGIMIPMRLDYNGRELNRMSFRRLVQKRIDWATKTNASGPVSDWATISLTRFVICPIDAVGGSVLDMTGVAPITPLVNSGDPVTLDDAFADLLVDYGRMRAPLKEGGATFANASIAYQAMVKKLKTMTIWSGMAFPQYWLLKSEEPAESPNTGLH